MNVTLWIIASLLAAVFVAVGARKLTTPREKLIPKMASVADFSDSQVKAVAAAEVLGAVGSHPPRPPGHCAKPHADRRQRAALMMVRVVAVHLRRGNGVGMRSPRLFSVCSRSSWRLAGSVPNSSEA